MSTPPNRSDMSSDELLDELEKTIPGFQCQFHLFGAGQPVMVSWNHSSMQMKAWELKSSRYCTGIYPTMRACLEAIMKRRDEYVADVSKTPKKKGQDS